MNNQLTNNENSSSMHVANWRVVACPSSALGFAVRSLQLCALFSRHYHPCPPPEGDSCCCRRAHISFSFSITCPWYRALYSSNVISRQSNGTSEKGGWPPAVGSICGFSVSGTGSTSGLFSAAGVSIVFISCCTHTLHDLTICERLCAPPLPPGFHGFRFLEFLRMHDP